MCKFGFLKVLIWSVATSHVSDMLAETKLAKLEYSDCDSSICSLRHAYEFKNWEKYQLKIKLYELNHIELDVRFTDIG